MKYCTCKNQSQKSAFQPSENLHFENFIQPMMGLIVDPGYQGISDTLSVNSAQKINKMALLIAIIKFKIAFSSGLRTYTWKIFPGPILVGLTIDTGY